MAMIIRAQLSGPGNHLVPDQQYNELFTMHGTIMLLLFATPLFAGFANEIMPLQTGRQWIASRQAASNSSSSGQTAAKTASRSGVQ